MKMLVILLASITSSASAMTLDEYLARVQERNRQFQSFDSSRQAASARREQGDLALAPALTAQARRLDDRKPMLAGPGMTLDRTAGSDYSLGLAKKFSTGTSAEISANMSNIGAHFPNGTGGTISPNVSAGVGISLSQSLWKDFFGHATRLRWEREAYVEKTEIEAVNLQARQLLIEAEAAFWELLYLQEEVRQREDSLARAKRIEGWVRRRVSNGIGDRADLLNAQGLVAMRELQLMTSVDERKAAEEKVRLMLELPGTEKAPVLKADLAKARPVEGMIATLRAAGAAKTDSRIVRLDSYLAVLEAKAKAVVAQEVEDGMRPDLVLEGTYRTNSYEPDWSDATAKITDTAAPTMGIGLRFTYILGGAKESTRRVARMEALAAAHKKERLLFESDSAWREFLRRHSELAKKIQAAGKASQIQTSKAAAERDKLSKGRSITSQVIQAEQDAAETTLTLTKLQAEQRKLEAQARLFVRLEEAP